MVWFGIQSLPVIALAFLLGLAVGWSWWRRRKVNFDRSDAMAAVSATHRAEVRDVRAELQAATTAGQQKDAEIERLQALASGDAAELAQRHQGELDDRDARIAELAAALADHEADVTRRIEAREAELADLFRAREEELNRLHETREAELASRQRSREAELNERLEAREVELAARLRAQESDLTARLDSARADLTTREAELAAREAELRARADELGRLALVIERAESTAAGHREELAARGRRLEEQAVTLAERDAEIQRLTAALDAALDAATTTGDVAAAPTDPTAAEIAPHHTPVQEILAATGSPDAGGRPDRIDLEAAGGAATAVPDTSEPVTIVLVEDDLERVEGIGPRIGTALRRAGIHSFRQLADAEPAALQAALEQAGLRFAPSLPTWSRQAALLADGDEDGFREFTERLVAGRDVTRSR